MATSSKLEVEVPLPKGINVLIDSGLLTVKGPKGTISKKMDYPGISIVPETEKVLITAFNEKKSLKVMKGTYAAHIRNMVLGVTKGFEYSLKVLNSHFPMTVKQAGDHLTIDNFLGEKTPRKSRIMGDVKVHIKGDTVTLTGNNIEEVAQSASNIELATKVKGRDRRVFQDGIYIVSKGVAGE